MLNHPTLDRLHELGLEGMAKGFRDLAANPESRTLDHAEWLGLLVEQEATLRQQKRFAARTRTAKLRQTATVEDVDLRAQRGLDRALFLRLTSCDWGARASALPDHRPLRHRQKLHRLRIG